MSEISGANERSRGSKQFWDDFFELRARGSSLPTEVLAGCSTFLALSYIIVVNPAILSQGGFDKTAVFFATVVVSGAATIAMGLWARLPFAVAPGMEMNALVAFYAIGTLGFTWQEALGLVFWSGILMIVVTLLKIRETIIDSIPTGMRVGLATAVGIFIVLIALSISRVLRYEGSLFKSFGSLATPSSAALIIGLLSTFALNALNVPGSVLVAVGITSVACLTFLGFPPEAVDLMPGSLASAVGALDLTVILNPKSISVVLVLFVLDFYGSVAKFIGLTMATSIAPNGLVPRRKEGLLVDGAATVAGSMIGTTSLIAFVESAVGIGAGGRTGITAVVCGLLMLGSLAFAPLLKYVPVVATTGTLVFVGWQLLPKREVWHAITSFDRFVVVAMCVIVVVTFSIDKAMLFAFTAYVIRQLTERTFSPALVGSAILLASTVIFQFI